MLWLLPLSVPIRELVSVGGSLAYLLWATCGFYRSRRVSVILRGLVAYGAFHLGMLFALQMTILWWMGR